MTLAKNPLKKHYIGLPCMFGEAVFRVIGEHESGSWGNINGEDVFSVPLIATPHGTIIHSGRFYLDEITEEGMQKLIAFEEHAKDQGKELYAGKYNPKLIKMLNKEDLAQYGKVEICEEIDGKFYIKITDGFSSKAKNTFSLMEKINDSIGSKFSVIHKCVTDENLFDYVLKQKDYSITA